MLDNDIAAGLMNAANWVWGIATEEGFVRVISTACRYLFPWFKPAVRRFRTLPHDWQLLAGTLGISGLAFFATLLMYGVVGQLTTSMLAMFMLLSTVIGLTSGMMWHRLEQEGLAPWSKRR